MCAYRISTTYPSPSEFSFNILRDAGSGNFTPALFKAAYIWQESMGKSRQITRLQYNNLPGYIGGYGNKAWTVLSNSLHHNYVHPNLPCNIPNIWILELHGVIDSCEHKHVNKVSICFDSDALGHVLCVLNLHA